jgi:hypothetical protein
MKQDKSIDYFPPFFFQFYKGIYTESILDAKSGMGNQYLECKLIRGLSAKTPVEET